MRLDQHWVGRSCGNRHCPTCQVNKTAHLAEKKQSARLLPVHHFLVGFTVAGGAEDDGPHHQAIGYRTLFDAGSATIRKLMADPRWLGSKQIGMFGVLHTWGRDPTVYHPHVHFVVAGGGVSPDRSRWLSTPRTSCSPKRSPRRSFAPSSVMRLRRQA